MEDESAFFGAMDGASKFVKGDAIASIIIVAINLLGGSWNEYAEVVLSMTIADTLLEIERRLDTLAMGSSAACTSATPAPYTLEQLADDAAALLDTTWRTSAATVNGLVTEALGHLPIPGETVTIGDIIFEVGGGMQLTEEVPWIAPLGVSYALGVDGLGLLTFESVMNRDYPVVFANIYILSLLGLVVNLLSDLTYTWIDPRIDFETRET